MNSTPPPVLQSVKRALDVLVAFEAAEPVQTPAQVASRLGLNRTTAWRYLVTLAASGLVRELPGGRFALGGRTVALAESYTHQWGRFGSAGGVALVRLRDATGETAALHIREGWTRVPIRQVESQHELHRTYRDLGEPVSLLVGSPSLAILANLSEQEQASYLDSHADLAPEGRDEVLRRLAGVRAQGYATTEGARAPNVSSVAAPVRDRHGRVLGAINVTGPEQRFTADSVPRFIAEVTGTAGWIEEQLRDTDGAGAATP